MNGCYLISSRSSHTFAFSCSLFFFDSLEDYHNGNTYGKSIRNWLNSEWKRIRECKATGPFNEKSMPMIIPEGKFVQLVVQIIISRHCV